MKKNREKDTKVIKASFFFRKNKTKEDVKRQKKNARQERHSIRALSLQLKRKTGLTNDRIESDVVKVSSWSMQSDFRMTRRSRRKRRNRFTHGSLGLDGLEGLTRSWLSIVEGG